MLEQPGKPLPPARATSTFRKRETARFVPPQIGKEFGGMMFLPILLTGLVLLGGCAELLDRVPHSSMAPRLSYQGFSFDRPSSRDWYMLRSEENYTDVTLRRDFWKPSDTHSFYARVSIGSIERQPTSHEEFAELARSDRQSADYEVKLVSYDQLSTTRQNQWCIRLDASYLVVGAPISPDRNLAMIIRGYRCLHPTWPKATLDFFFSERGLPDEIDPDLAREGEKFLDGVRIDVAPDRPAA